MESTADPSWDGLSQMDQKLHKGSHRLAAPGDVDHTQAYPYPAIPSAVADSDLDRDTLTKVKGLYADRYVLLDRSIEDIEKRRLPDQRIINQRAAFSTERNSTLQEMSHVAVGKDEFVRFAFRNRNCFDQYEAFSASQNRDMQQQLANTQATLRANEEIWAHAEAPAAVDNNTAPTAPTPVAVTSGAKGPDVKSEPIDGKRTPASSGNSLPAIVPEDANGTH